MSMMMRNPRFLTIAVMTLLVSCAGAAERAQPRLATAELAITREGGGTVTVTAELARTNEERMKGLMFRTSLPDGEGMLFIYDHDLQMSFWMKNTPLPLSIAFISAAGVILEIRDMEPHSVRSVQSARSCRYALEVARGWFDRAGVAAGDTAAIPPGIPALDAGL